VRRHRCCAGATQRGVHQRDGGGGGGVGKRSQRGFVAGRLKQFFGGTKLDKAKLAALGTRALLAYGFVSNVNAVTLLIISWVSFAKSTGLSPLAPGQWKAYLLAYTALCVPAPDPAPDERR
jgi:hypothetical protein